MKVKFAAVFSICALALFATAVFALVLSPLRPASFGANGTWFQPSGDFKLRCTEVQCLLKGVNPYDVWHGDVIMRPYRPNYAPNAPQLRAEDGYDTEINAYAPWEYTMMIPFALLPMSVSWPLYAAILYACLFVLLYSGWKFARREGLSTRGSVVVGALTILLAAVAVAGDFDSGNFGIIVCTSAVLMAACLDKARESTGRKAIMWKALTGLCWAITMLKPQLGLIFAIPLLMRKEFLACAIASSICALLTIPPSILCHVSPITLIMQTPQANTFAFNGCGTLPYGLHSLFPVGFAINLALAIGAVICIAMTFALRKEKSAVVYLFPAAVMATTWTYSLRYSYVLLWFYFALLLVSLAKNPHSRKLWIIAALSLFFPTRAFSGLHFAILLLPHDSGILGMLHDNFYYFDSVSSTVCILLAIALCRAYDEL